MRVGAGGGGGWGMLQSRSSTLKTSPKTSVRVDGLQRLAETGFKGWRLSEGRWKSRLKLGRCERTDAAVRTRRLEAHRVNLLLRHAVSSPGRAVSKLAVPSSSPSCYPSPGEVVPVSSVVLGISGNGALHKELAQTVHGVKPIASEETCAFLLKSLALCDFWFVLYLAA